MDSDSTQFTTPDDMIPSVVSKHPTPTRPAQHRLQGVRHGAQVIPDGFTVRADKAGHRDIAGGH